MNIGLYQSAASLTALERWQDVVAQNITSSQTTGFRKRTVQFSTENAGEWRVEHGAKTKRSGVAQAAVFPKISTGINFDPGETQTTRRELDVAIQGPGFFELKQPDGQLTYTRSGTVAGASSSSTTALVGALAATYTTTSVTSGVWGQSKTEVRPEMLRLTRTETASGTTTIGQTQIAARSASFAGVVTVQGDLKVQGVLRVAAHGDISMGEFTNGPMP